MPPMRNARQRSSLGSYRPKNTEPRAQTAERPGNNRPAPATATVAAGARLPRSVPASPDSSVLDSCASWFVHEVALPDRPFVKRIGNRLQVSSGQIEKQPDR